MNGGPSESIEVEALLATSVLDADNVPNKNQSETCFSCGSKMLGLFCKDCGQKNDDLRRSIFFLITEAFTSFFSIESRMWRTWLSLFRRPGQAAREFADGKRTLWTSPVRIYLAMSIILFGYMSLTETRLISVRTEVTAQTGVIGEVETLSDIQVTLSPKLLFFARQKKLDDLNEGVDFDRVEKLISGIPFAKFSPENETTLNEALKVLSQIPDAEELPDGILKLLEGRQAETDIMPSSESGQDAKSSNLLDVIPTGDLANAIQDEIESFVDDLNDKDESEKTPTDIEAENIRSQLRAQRKAIGKLNGLLGSYPNIQDFAKGLSEGNVSLSEQAFLDNLPVNLTPEKRTELSININETLMALKDANITEEVISELKLELYKKSPLFFNNLTINGTELNSTQIQQLAMNIIKRPAVLNEAFATYLPRIMFFMMPFAMFAGIVFIRGKKTALMYDHLVHAAYIHAFAYLFLLSLIIVSQWTNITGLAQIFFLGMLIYLPISAKYMFKRGWFKTLLTSYSIGFQYSIVMFFIMIALLASQLTISFNLV